MPNMVFSSLGVSEYGLGIYTVPSVVEAITKSGGINGRSKEIVKEKWLRAIDFQVINYGFLRFRTQN